MNKSSPGDILHALNWRRHYDDQREKTLWETARQIGFWLLQPHVEKGKMEVATDLVLFPWEESDKPAKKELTPEEKQAQKEKFARWDEEQRIKHGSK